MTGQQLDLLVGNHLAIISQTFNEWQVSRRGQTDNLALRVLPPRQKERKPKCSLASGNHLSKATKVLLIYGIITNNKKYQKYL